MKPPKREDVIMCCLVTGLLHIAGDGDGWSNDVMMMTMRDKPALVPLRLTRNLHGIGPRARH
jgi:hypothetical protein